MSALCGAALLCLSLALDAQTVNERNTTDIYNTTGDPDGLTDRYSTLRPSSSTAVPEEPELPAEPLPESGRPPSADTPVLRWCPCDVLQAECDINCCCDSDCSGQEVSLFSGCSVLVVSSSNEQLCSRDVASYSLRSAADGRSELMVSVGTEINPDPLCIHSQNRVEGFSHPTPDTPSDRTFDQLFGQFSSFGFGPAASEQHTSSSGYQYGDVVRTAAQAENRGVLLLPASGLTAECVDSPAAFLVEQHHRCSRRVLLDQDCSSSPALSMDTYTDIQLLSGRSADSAVVPVRLEAVFLQSTSGTQTVWGAAGGAVRPVLLEPGLCANVVLQVSYVMVFSSAGEVVDASVSVLLGAVQGASLQQEVHITYVQVNAGDFAVSFSGSPGYILGLPLVSGTRTAGGTGFSRSSELRDSVSVLQYADNQDCLQGAHQHSPVLFGINSVSGCTLRLTEALNCSLVSQQLLGVLSVLRASHQVLHVASFGNSPVDLPEAWVQVESVRGPEAAGCSVPVSFHLRVEWTKYGALENPQAQIVSVTERIEMNSSSLERLSGGGGVLPITSSVVFVSVSAKSRPGFRAPPTINARLPFDFFFPFV